MRKQLALCLSFVLAAGISYASPSSKFAANVKDLTIVPATSSDFGYVTVLQIPIKTPNKKDLLVGASFETGLYTRTLVKSKLGISDTEKATAQLNVRILVDGQQTYPDVAPNEVIFDRRLQEMTATLGGVISSCTDANADGTIDVATECVVTDETIELILDTMAAHHFNFVVSNVEAGDHLLEVQVLGTTTTSSGDAGATVAVGRGSLTVEEVRAVNQGTGLVFEQ
ncbi:MAG: hypothetical protein HY900_30830 [Deltaproteobacteria bacterium]|nr:hypothetical protein [Deltaproteobacteria bacterium]